MKISKLFHWLYAFLMLLPVFGVLFKVGYVMLNENAYQSYNGNYAYNSQIQLSNVSSDFNTKSNWTKHNDNNYSYTDSLYFSSFTFKDFGAFTVCTYGFNIDINTSFIPGFTFSNNTVGIYLNVNVQSNSIHIYELSSPIDYTTSIPLNVAGTLVNNPFTGFLVTTDNTIYTNFGSGSGVGFLQDIYFDTYIVDTTLSSVFYASLQEINNTEFFSWAKDSFLVQPIMYIGALFGITNPHPIFTFMSYWLAISIIWLVFDLVMYVPLLVHRWIDKGVIE